MAGVSEKSSEWSLMALRVGSVVVLLGAWEFTARLHIFSDFLLPSLSTVLLRLFHDTVSGDLVHGITLTLIRTAIGFVAAAVAGVAPGPFSCVSPTTSRTSSASAAAAIDRLLGVIAGKGGRSRPLQSRLRVLYPD